MEYSRDEALRVVSMTLMLEGHTYQFRVQNSGEQFTLLLEEHILSGLEHLRCKHTADPCAANTRSVCDIKEIAWASIAEHNRKFHHLTTVK